MRPATQALAPSSVADVAGLGTLDWVSRCANIKRRRKLILIMRSSSGMHDALAALGPAGRWAPDRWGACLPPPGPFCRPARAHRPRNPRVRNERNKRGISFVFWRALGAGPVRCVGALPEHHARGGHCCEMRSCGIGAKLGPAGVPRRDGCIDTCHSAALPVSFASLSLSWKERLLRMCACVSRDCGDVSRIVSPPLRRAQPPASETPTLPADPPTAPSSAVSLAKANAVRSAGGDGAGAVGVGGRRDGCGFVHSGQVADDGRPPTAVLSDAGWHELSEGATGGAGSVRARAQPFAMWIVDRTGFLQQAQESANRRGRGETTKRCACYTPPVQTYCRHRSLVGSKVDRRSSFFGVRLASFVLAVERTMCNVCQCYVLELLRCLEISGILEIT